jgi:hypothetical protein
MKIPRYWSKATYPTTGPDGRPGRAACWRWSDVSVEEAARLAGQRAAELAARLQSGQPLDRYAYSDRPLREEIVQEVKDGEQTLALVTRNSYGALVLNAAQAMFVDVDFPKQPPASVGGLLGKLFGKKMAPAPDPQAGQMQRISAWLAARLGAARLPHPGRPAPAADARRLRPGQRRQLGSAPGAQHRPAVRQVVPGAGVLPGAPDAQALAHGVLHAADPRLALSQPGR